MYVIGVCQLGTVKIIKLKLCVSNIVVTLFAELKRTLFIN